MGPPAQIHVLPLAVQADRLHVRRQIIDQFDLVGFSLFLEERDGLLPRKSPPRDKGMIRRRDLLHPFFDFFQIFRRKGLAYSKS